MRKEVFWAIVAGIFLGLIVAFGVYRINSSMYGGKNNGRNISLATPTPQPGNSSELKIILDKPENDDVVTTKTISVSGLTKPLSWVTFSGEDSDYTIQSDTTGTFSQDVDLIAGVNQIKVTAFNNSGQKSATEVLVVYSSSFQTRVAPIDAQNNASGTSDIRQKVAQDVANAMNRPKAYIGIVTDITSSTIEIKSTSSQIEQISVSADGTSVVNSTGTTSKTVKISDIAIGDFIVAMGYINGNSVLGAQRILITDPVTEPKLTVSQAKVASVTKKALTVNKFPDNTPDTVTPDKNTDIEAVAANVSKAAKFAAISAEDTVIYVVTTDDKGVNTVRSVFQLSSS